MTKPDIQQRIERLTYRSQRRHWYQHWWGKALIFVTAVIFVEMIIFIFFVSFYYQKLYSGEILGRALDSVEQQARLDLLQNGIDPSLGPEIADITVVAFEDYSCPFSLQSQPLIKQLVAKYPGRLKFIYKDFPLSAIHPKAEAAAEAAQCAFEQDKFWEYQDALFADQERYSDEHFRSLAKELGLNISRFNECYNTHKYKQSVAEDVRLGRSLGVRGTPTWFVNGELVAEGYGPGLEALFDKVIEYISGL